MPPLHDGARSPGPSGPGSTPIATVAGGGHSGAGNLSFNVQRHLVNQRFTSRHFRAGRRGPESSVTFGDQRSAAVQTAVTHPALRDQQKPHLASSFSASSQGHKSLAIQFAAAAKTSYGCYESEVPSDSSTDSEEWTTHGSADSANELSGGMQLSMLYEASQWFPHTSFYAKMKDSAQPEVDKEHAYRDPGEQACGKLFLNALVIFLLSPYTRHVADAIMYTNLVFTPA